jgi:hypothetical protein
VRAAALGSSGHRGWRGWEAPWLGEAAAAALNGWHDHRAPATRAGACRARCQSRAPALDTPDARGRRTAAPVVPARVGARGRGAVIRGVADPAQGRVAARVEGVATAPVGGRGGRGRVGRWLVCHSGPRRHHSGAPGDDRCPHRRPAGGAGGGERPAGVERIMGRGPPGSARPRAAAMARYHRRWLPVGSGSSPSTSSPAHMGATSEPPISWSLRSRPSACAQPQPNGPSKSTPRPRSSGKCSPSRRPPSGA